MLKADGVRLPTPTDYTQGIEEISKAERNAAGTMVKDVIAFKDKLILVWQNLTQEELSLLTVVKKKNSVMLEYISMETGTSITGHFYTGSIQATGIQYKNGKIEYWKDVKMNFIEM